MIDEPSLLVATKPAYKPLLFGGITFVSSDIFGEPTARKTSQDVASVAWFQAPSLCAAQVSMGFF